jgi:glucosyltransferase
MSLLSVIVPCYNEEESVALFYQELTKNDPFFKEKEIELELLYIDDGSKDGTVREVKKLIEQDSRVHIVSFSRNFGKEAAMFAGLEKSKGDYVVMMDVDLQDPPSLLPEMFEWIWQGYDSVATRRVTADPQLFCQKILPSDEEDFPDGNDGRSERLSPDDQTDGGCHPVHAGI